MWQIYYVRAQEIAQERIREAERERLARRALPASAGRTRLDGLRRGCAGAAPWPRPVLPAGSTSASPARRSRHMARTIDSAAPSDHTPPIAARHRS
jgi:hypothetical protein